MAGLETNLGELLLTAAQATPRSVCLETEEAAYTFEQLALMVASIRRALSKALLGLEPSHPGLQDEIRAHERHADEHVVTIVLERGVKNIASIHAVMLEKCAYNAFDVAEPVEKLHSWVDICHPAVIISTRALCTDLRLDAISKFHQFPRYILDVDWALKRQPIAIAAKHDQEDLDRLAYLIFTSGSTGKPKAVMIRHASALNVARVWSAAIGLCSWDRFAQISSMAWDVHVIEIYGAMAVGATSVTCPDLVKQSGPDMLLWLRHKQVTGISAVPSHLRTMVPAGVSTDVNLPQLRIVDVGGEALGTDVVSTWAPGRLLFNSYGPTEISVVCTGIAVRVGDPITLGPALPGYQCHILDPKTFAMKKAGEVGVLFVGGVGLARGYLGEEGQTNQKFIELAELGRLFNTGDLAFKDNENRLHFRGRVDSQVKVRGLRIELEALEAAIMDLGTVKHCEARVLDGRLVLLASGSGSFLEAELKAKAMSLGRGYVLSQVKLVEDNAWKFSSGGKLLRNVVPWSDDAWDASDSFHQLGASALELEIAACVALQVRGVEYWDRNSHFVDDLGIDSAGMGQLLGQMRSKTKLQKVDLRALFNHPTVSMLASFLSEPDSDPEDELFDGEQTGQNLVSAIWKSMQTKPHSTCCELPSSCLSYTQLFRLATAFRQLLRRNRTTSCKKTPVAICMDMMTERMAAILAVLMEGHAFCVLDQGHEFTDQLQAFDAQCILASSKDVVWARLQEICYQVEELQCMDVSSASLPLQVRLKLPAIDPDDVCFQYIHEDLEGHDERVSRGQTLTVLTASHRAILELLETWPALQRARAASLPAAAANLAVLKILMSGGAWVDRDSIETLLCNESGLNGEAFTSLSVLAGQKRCLVVTPGQGSNAARDSLVRQTRNMMTASSLFPGLLGPATHSFGEKSWPNLCAGVQGSIILLEPVLIAARMMLAERVLLPLTFVIPLWQTFLLLWAVIICEKILRVILLLAAKWVLIGRYQEAKHDIYSLFYLRHWLVERIADGTIIGTATPPGTSVAHHFLRNLVLRALGADVALTSMIFTRVVAFDLVSVGHLATVNGLKHLTAVNYGEGKMVLKSISVGQGAFIGANAVLEPGCSVAAAAHVEALSMIPAGSRVSGRASGVPVEAVVNHDAANPRSIPLDADVRQFCRNAALMASTYWLMVVPQALMPFIIIMIFQLEAKLEYPADSEQDLECFDSLPEGVLSFLPQLPLWSFAFTVLILALQLLLTVLICRLLPRVKPPCSYLLTSIRGQMVSLKMRWVNQASNLLRDASMVPVFMRLCGARFGHGVAIAEEVVLPDTLVVGHGCFIASRNILTSATVDQGHFRVPCVTNLGDHSFVGNDNCLPAGLPEGSFCGLNTSLPNRPQQRNLGYFGTPAMVFKRPIKDGPQEATSRTALCWFHFSTSVIDIFILRGLKGMVLAASFVMSRYYFPATKTWVLGVLCMVMLIYLIMNITSWLVFSVFFGRFLYNETTPTSSAYHSRTVTRWFTSIMLQKHVFTSPFRTVGSCWHAHHFRLRGARIGKRFFCVHDIALIDAPFISIGDDVIVDYDADIRCHSFEDRQLKFSPVKIGNRARIMAAAKVARSDVGEGAVLRPSSVTWKGSNLEANRVYQGAPAVEALDPGVLTS